MGDGAGGGRVGWLVRKRGRGWCGRGYTNVKATIGLRLFSNKSETKSAVRVTTLIFMSFRNTCAEQLGRLMKVWAGGGWVGRSDL